MKVNQIVMSIIVLMMCHYTIVRGQSNNVPYKYPITHGEEWAKLYGKDFDNRVAACEVPEEILKEMTTEALLETCLNYPLNYETTLSSNKDSTFTFLTGRSNAYKELFDRKDLVKVILKKFEDSDPNRINHFDDYYEESLFWQKQGMFGLLIANDKVLKRFSTKEKKELVKHSLNKIEKMEMNKKEYSIATIALSNLHLTKIVEIDSSISGKQNALKFEAYKNSGVGIDSATYDLIKKNAVKYLEKE